MTPSIAIYGPPKIGKSFDVHTTFLGRTLTILTERGGTNSIKGELLIVPCYDIQKPLLQFESLLDGEVAKQAKKGAFKVLVVDSGSELAVREVDYLVGDQHMDVRQAFYATQIGLRRLIRKTQALGKLVVWLFHEQGPEEKRGEYQKGGPALPGKVVKQVPYMFDMILRAKWHADLGEETSRVYCCDPSDESYYMGDRFRAAKMVQPMDLRPIIKAIATRLRGDGGIKGNSGQQ